MRALKTFAGMVLDMDGTFFLGDQLLPGALELLAFLNDHEIRFSFLTNNTSRGKQDYIGKLTRLGVKMADARVYTAGDATISYLKAFYPDRRVFLMGTRSLAESFVANGIRLVEDDAEVCVLGYDTELTYARLCQFTRWVNQGLPYIATHPDINCPAPGGYVPDIGAMMALIEASTGRKADLVVGKPNPQILEQLAHQWGVPTADLVMVGDRLYTDIALGTTAGVQTVLVLSGETSRQDLVTSPYQPDVVCENLQDLITLLTQQGADSSALVLQPPSPDLPQ